MHINCGLLSGDILVCSFISMLTHSPPLLPFMLLLPFPRLLMSLQLPHELIQDLLGCHRRHIPRVLLQKCHLDPSPNAPAVTVHAASLEVWRSVSMVHGEGRLLLCLLALGLRYGGVPGSHFIIDGSTDIVKRDGGAGADRLMLPRDPILIHSL